jgi:hypothetical protein
VTSKHDDAEAAANALANRIPRDQLNQLLALRQALKADGTIAGTKAPEDGQDPHEAEVAAALALAGVHTDTELAQHPER